ncbi:MAG: PaaI family thioesterase [Bacteroidetes bacterium]|nr:PaaI family thioesterase [Bacteroidota bacterium]MBL6943778.1 PaaI family thioesterase [Bacteroidales bacterium]
MKKILNPYTKIEGYNCFGCSPKNDLGLKMNFFEDGDYLICDWEPNGLLQGYHNVLHGGIQATLMDEIGSWFVQVKIKTAGVTSKMNIRYIHPVSIGDGNIKLRASLLQKRRNLVDVKVELFDTSEKLCANGELTYYTFPIEIAKKKLYYPDYDEFFEKD